jgi:hypothetical protein
LFLPSQLRAVTTTNDKKPLEDGVVVLTLQIENSYNKKKKKEKLYSNYLQCYFYPSN